MGTTSTRTPLPELGSLINDTPEPVEVAIQGETVTVQYHPARITPLWLESLNENDPRSLAKALAEVISSWDVLENGQPLEPSEQVFASFPFPVLAAFSEAVAKAAAGSEEGNVSSTSPASREPASTSPSSTAQNHSSPSTSRQPVTAT